MNAVFSDDFTGVVSKNNVDVAFFDPVSFSGDGGHALSMNDSLGYSQLLIELQLSLVGQQHSDWQLL